MMWYRAIPIHNFLEKQLTSKRQPSTRELTLMNKTAFKILRNRKWTKKGADSVELKNKWQPKLYLSNHETVVLGAYLAHCCPLGHYPALPGESVHLVPHPAGPWEVVGVAACCVFGSLSVTCAVAAAGASLPTDETVSKLTDFQISCICS